MGYTFAEITLRNALDGLESELMEEPKNRQKTVQALVDTGAHWLVVSEELRRELGLKIVGEKSVFLADNTKIICQRTGLVEIHWKDRCAVQTALVVPERPNVLLGVYPLEEMDLIVDPVRQELAGAHGDEWVMYI